MSWISWWIKKRQMLRDFAEDVRNHDNVVNDPMNGCPGDFAEDFARDERRAILELYSVGATDEEIAKAEARGHELAARDNAALWDLVGGRR